MLVSKCRKEALTSINENLQEEYSTLKIQKRRTAGTRGGTSGNPESAPKPNRYGEKKA